MLFSSLVDIGATMEWYLLDPLIIIVGLSSSFVCYLWLYPKALRRERRIKFPPGPKGLPLVGNLFDIPTTKAWMEYQKWGERYGMT